MSRPRMSIPMAQEWGMRPMPTAVWETRLDRPRDLLSDDRDKGYLTVVDNVGRRLFGMAFMATIAVMANVAVAFASWR